LCNVSGYSQNKNGAAIKIYLTDAENGKVVKNARVTLEGFEIPPIEGNYDKKGKYYYFTEIPEGYNTVMSYHKDYNEKGFQNTDGLPKEVRLKLYDPLNVSYEFERPVLRKINRSYLQKTNYLKRLEKNLDKNDSVIGRNFRHLYVEDSYHIAIISKLYKEQFFNNDILKKTLNDLSLVYIPSITDTIPEYKCDCYAFNNNGNFYFDTEIIGLNNSLNLCEADPFQTSYRVYFFTKKDKSKFKRFNSKEILELRKLNLFVVSITIREVEYYGKHKYLVEYSHDKNDIIFNPLYGQKINEYFRFSYIRKSKQVFLNGNKKKFKLKKGEYFVTDYMPEMSENFLQSIYFVSTNNNLSSGLGIADMIEKERDNTYLFFNELKK